MSTSFCIAANHPALEGHFPGQPIVPGVVLLDAVVAAIEAKTGAPLPPLALPQVKFMQPLLPAQPATIALDATAAPTGTRWRFSITRSADAALLARGEIFVSTDE